jgi:NhaP-type Na+/H+ or K+/H+ antiporter
MAGELAFFALLLAGYALVAARLDRLSISAALAFVAIGVVSSEGVLGLVGLQPHMEAVKLLAEGALTLLLFADAAAIRRKALAHDVGSIVRLLAIGLPLTVVLGTIGAVLLFPGVTLGLALLVASTLAPTDAALGQPVVTNPNVPSRIRRVLYVQSGLTDGIATPVVFLAIGLAGAEATGHDGWLIEAIVDSAIGALVGVGLGLGGSAALDLATRAGWTSAASRRLFVLALAAACYLVAGAFGGNGFIAAFLGGLAFGIGSHHHAEHALRFTETQGSLLAIGVWTAFGLLIGGQLEPGLWDARAIAYAALSLTVIRMVPVAIALLGTRLRTVTVLFMGWFGPRGLASIVFLIIGLEGLEEAGVRAGPLAAAVAWTVLLSVILHGITAGPLASRYGRLAKALPSDAPELVGTEEPATTRVHWAGETPT